MQKYCHGYGYVECFFDSGVLCALYAVLVCSIEGMTARRRHDADRGATRHVT
jgi:hypothetical protein